MLSNQCRHNYFLITIYTWLLCYELHPSNIDIKCQKYTGSYCYSLCNVEIAHFNSLCFGNVDIAIFQTRLYTLLTDDVDTLFSIECTQYKIFKTILPVYLIVKNTVLFCLFF